MNEVIGTSPVKNARLPGLDGLRALAVVGVIAYHLVTWQKPGFLHGRIGDLVVSILSCGQFGVSVFFVLSGFLITWLLLKEERKEGHISLWRFYFRRSMRILPPAYFFLAFVGVLALLKQISVPARDLLSAAGFIRNYYWVPVGNSQSPVTSHFWSLAVEEQFYLFWPAFLLATPRRARLPLVIALVLAAPIWKVIWFRHLAGHGFITWRFDIVYGDLLVGCLLAMLLQSGGGRRILQGPIFQNTWVVPACLIGLGLCWPPDFVRERLPWIVRAPAYSMGCIFVAIIINRVMCSPTDWIGRVLNHPIVVGLGFLSYSLYLWQEIFCCQPPGHILTRFPINILASLTMAAFSYFALERPALRLRGILEKQWSQPPVEPLVAV